MFHFKQFSISHSQSTMKVGTDAVLLGAWMPVPENCETILEIGSGCGVISLMLAQRTNAKITGIDIDEKSVKEAQKNAENSIWKNNVQFIHENVLNFAQKTTQKFELIVSNPPFFENSLKSPKTIRNISRHNDTLTLEQILNTVNILLPEKGRFGIILPVNASEKLVKLALEKNIYLTKKTHVYPTPSKKTNRMLMMFERENNVCEEDNLIIRDDRYTEAYCGVVGEYLLIEGMKD
jgi:tRNA1Val (adenine37-N6)-methyltransferase